MLSTVLEAWHGTTRTKICVQYSSFADSGVNWQYPAPHAGQWSHIDADDMMSSSELHMLLGRAGGLPLHFSCDCSDGLLEYIIPHMDRVQTLQVILEADPVEDLTPCGIFFKSAPLLEALHISSSDEGQPHANVPTLFNDCAPRLSRLFLSQYFVCATNRFPSLTHLYLHAQYTFSPESLSQFLDFLDGSPMLEELVLESAGPCVVSVLLDVFPLPRTVTLRRLRSLVFLECFWAVPACILRHVVPGPHVEIKIKELQQLYRSTELFSIFAEGAAFLRHLDNPTQLSLWCPERHFYMQCATPSASVTLDITFHSCLPGSEQGTLVSTLLVELPNLLPLAGVTDFRMRVDRAAHIWSPAVRSLHSALPAVEAYTLWLDPELNKRYWRAILASKLHAPIFPRLRALHVVGALPITWRPYWAMGLAISWAKHGRPLDDLTFTVVSASPCMVTLAKWDPERVHIGGQRVSDFVKKLQFRGVAYGASGMSLPLIKGWDGRVEV